MLELGVKVLGNTAGAILQVRDHLNRETIDRAIDLLTAAERIEFYAVGHYGVVADDAQFKFLRFGVLQRLLHRPAAAAAGRQRAAADRRGADHQQQRARRRSGGGGRPARERGAAVVAITASHSPLAKKADLALIVDHVEDVATHVPMISRILHLLVIDILAVGVAMRRGADAALPQAVVGQVDEAGPPSSRRPRPTAWRRASAPPDRWRT